MAEKKSFVLYNDYIRHIERLSDAEAGQLFKALFLFAESGEVTELSSMAEMAFSFISEQMERDREKWEKICQKRSDAIKKRWSKSIQTDTSVYKCIQNDTSQYKSIQTDTNDTDNDNVNENETVNVNENETVNVNENETVNVINDNNILYKGGMGENAPHSSPSPKAVKRKYGEYKHILLTDSQHQKLTDDYGTEIITQYITKIDEWIQLKGKSPYKDYNLAIHNWLNKDGVKKLEENQNEHNSRIYEGLI